MSKRLRIKPISEDVVARDRMVLASPRKVNLVARMIRGMYAADALNALRFCRKAVAADVRKTLLSAIANAETNNGLNVDSLRVKEAYVGKAITMKRFMARARGNGARINKTFSHLTLVLCETEN